jgi:flagellar hook-length control protein FliK
MQINTMGFPLGAGMQSASATGGTGLGFADALGLAIGGGQPVSLKASATPPENLNPMLARMLVVQAQLAAQDQPMPAASALPGLQQPTSMAELMATAAKLPGADALPAAAAASLALDTPLAVDVTADTAVLETAAAPISAAPEIVTAAPATPATAPLSTETEVATSAQPPRATVPAVPTEGDGEAQPEGDALPDAPVAAAPAETAPSRPLKGARRQAAAADVDPMLSADAKQAPGVEMLAANAVAQPVVAQQQPVTREASANAQGGSTVSKTGKVTVTAAPAQDGAQTPLGTATADFARAVAAKGESAGSESNPDGQPQPETVLAAAKADAAAPALPQPIQSANSADTARATAPAAPAEPVIEARAGHLGQSLGVEIARKVELGEETLRIRLNPIELGRIEVTLNFDEKGSLQATVRTDSVQAMDLLRQDASDLARTLDQAGVRTDAQSFRFENRGGDSGGQQAQQQQQNRGQFASSDDDAGIAEPIYRPIRSDGQVDLLA